MQGSGSQQKDVQVCLWKELSLAYEFRDTWWLFVLVICFSSTIFPAKELLIFFLPLYLYDRMIWIPFRSFMSWHWYLWIWSTWLPFFVLCLCLFIVLNFQCVSLLDGFAHTCFLHIFIVHAHILNLLLALCWLSLPTLAWLWNQSTELHVRASLCEIIINLLKSLLLW